MFTAAVNEKYFDISKEKGAITSKQELLGLESLCEAKEYVHFIK